MEMSRESFEVIVAEALDLVPQNLLDMLENVVFLVEDEPHGEEELLGLYEGVPRTERLWGDVGLPDRILIFRGPILRMSHTRAEVAREVAVTVVHEIAHHFGIDERRLHELGWG